ncbi:MAG: hypothetical protein PHS96_01525 [Anaerolineales bacterium]|nr:hypothetical protein [Anaerolineales bacterium]
MFVNIMQIPKIKEGQDAAFREWFAWSNACYARHKGFIARRLLQPCKGGNYLAVVEHESYETFMAMHTSPDQAEANQRVRPLFESGGPLARFYDAVEA